MSISALRGAFFILAADLPDEGRWKSVFLNAHRKRPLIALVFWLRRTFPLPLLRQGQDCAKYSEDRGLKKKRGRKISVGADYADFTDILLFYIIPVGGINWGMKAYERGYLRARAGISADKSGDIYPQSRPRD